jgi:hypothetical protein
LKRQSIGGVGVGIFLALLVLAAASCREYQNEGEYCDTLGSCTGGLICELKFKRCVSLDGGVLPITDGDAASPSDGDARDVGNVHDGATEEAPFFCHSDMQCTLALPACNSSGACVLCTDDYCGKKAGAGTPYCEPTARGCVQCTAMLTAQCVDKTPICGSDDMCRKCAADNECPARLPACDMSNVGGACLPCTDAYCKKTSADRPLCDTSAKTSPACVQCLTDKDCSGTTPICSGHACRKCQADTECASKLGGPDPGVCMEDGRCPTSDEVLYVKGGAASCPGAGTAAMPYCQAQTAMNAVAPGKQIVVIRGVVADWTLSFSSGPVTVVGQSGAMVRPGGVNDAVTINGTDVLIRDVAVSAGGGAGIVAKAGSTLRLHRCLVEGNTGGPGIQTTNTAFEIENTVIAKNGGTNFPGVNLGATTTMPRTFRNNTVVQNGAIGVVCGASYDIVGSIIFGNPGLQTLSCTAADPCATNCSVVDPKLDAGYQLTMSSPMPCKDLLTDAPATDRKGTARPQGATHKSDCGADELVQ